MLLKKSKKGLTAFLQEHLGWLIFILLGAVILFIALANLMKNGIININFLKDLFSFKR